MSIGAGLNIIVETIKTISGSLSRSHYERRHCSRCRKPLTDPGSWERGIGPDCARKDTALFAKSIPAKFALVIAHSMSIKTAELPEETRGVWSSLLVVLRGLASRGITQGQAAGGFAFTGEDNRLVAKIIDWLLSFPCGTDNKHNFIQIVKNLGFVGLASVLAGQASTGEAKLSFNESTGRLVLIGSSNKAGFLAMRKIPGNTVPRYRGDHESGFTAPATQHEAFLSVALEFWPCFSGDIKEIEEKCKNWLVAHPPVVQAPKAAKPMIVSGQNNGPRVFITHRSEDFTVKFDYNARIIAEIKSIPSKERSYDPGTYTWSVKKAHLQKVLDIFNATHTIEQLDTSSTATPSHLYPVKKAFPSRVRFSHRPW